MHAVDLFVNRLIQNFKIQVFFNSFAYYNMAWFLVSLFY